MFSDKENLNILTALLVSKGVSHAVVCPGSRNAPLVHNLAQVLPCTAATDERSAGFLALGLAQATGRPVAVCVTSGSALLNVAPAAAEAFYQHVPVVILSADRPGRWVDRLDGQTIHQPGALATMVKHSVCLPENAADTEAHWHCNLLVNEALNAATAAVPGPVHINVPLAEPLFCFTVEALPQERDIRICRPLSPDPTAIRPILQRLATARRPMVVLGQMSQQEAQPLNSLLHALQHRLPVLAEPLSAAVGLCCDAIFTATDEELKTLAPDFVLAMGGTLVSKRLRQFLRRCQPQELWEVNEEGVAHDTFMHQTGLMVCRPQDTLRHLASLFDQQGTTNEQEAWLKLWEKRRSPVAAATEKAADRFSQLSVVKDFERGLEQTGNAAHVHYANSTAVRLGCLFAHRHIWCNRGVNGIEGSLSAAAGFSLATTEKVFCVIGDLSFFYDQNALWNDALGGNLHILLLNNGGGGIFHQLPGLEQAGGSLPLIAGDHRHTARGICQQNHIDYLVANNGQEYASMLDRFLHHTGSRPVVLEVLTDVGQDAAAMRAATNCLQAHEPPCRRR